MKLLIVRRNPVRHAGLQYACIDPERRIGHVSAPGNLKTTGAEFLLTGGAASLFFVALLTF